MQANRYIQNSNSQQIKGELLSELYQWNAFWSYPGHIVNEENIDDNMLIENVLLYLDIEDINKLYKLYPQCKIKDVWKTRLCVLEPNYHSLNNMLGSLYFDIKNPPKYLKRIGNQRLKSIRQKADEWFSTAYRKDF
jgi:hypothetical protein